MAEDWVLYGLARMGPPVEKVSLETAGLGTIKIRVDDNDVEIVEVSDEDKSVVELPDKVAMRAKVRAIPRLILKGQLRGEAMNFNFVAPEDLEDALKPVVSEKTERAEQMKGSLDDVLPDINDVGVFITDAHEQTAPRIGTQLVIGFGIPDYMDDLVAIVTVGDKSFEEMEKELLDQILAEANASKGYDDFDGYDDY